MATCRLKGDRLTLGPPLLARGECWESCRGWLLRGHATFGYGGEYVKCWLGLVAFRYLK
ncbi:hypothetical protein E2C01_052027 [Portunus trituberculatus]|uniref:Uncharacterized protein n=1 Tax=Portunus trituberculatus TaxID=210409 RepID=A0A5B7GKW0_PORTR|nr:hypothetical protein [Portunus trituberculatus]